MTNLLWLDNIVFGNNLELSRDINDNFLKKVDLKKQRILKCLIDDLSIIRKEETTMGVSSELVKYQEKMQKAEAALQHELGGIRAGVANASLLNREMVEYYGAPTPLNQMAQISVPEARVLLVTPYDKSSLKDVEHALLASDLGLTPMNDGSAIRLVIPQLTEERRKELAKQVRAAAEKGKVAVRNVRREMMDSLKKAQKNGDMSEDVLHDLEDEAQKITDASIKNIDGITAAKEKEILAE